MYFRTGSDVADLAFHKDCRIDCLEGLDRFFRLPYVLFEWQRGKIEDDGIKSGLRRFYGLRERMCMIRVEKNRKIGLFAQTPDQSSDLTDPDKLPFALGRTDHDWDIQFLRGGEHRLQ